jgi:hypothetical protein
MSFFVMPDLIRHPEDSKNLIPAYSGMTDYSEIKNAYIYLYFPHPDMLPVRITGLWC